MTTAILNKKKTTKTAKVKNETLLRAKTMQRAAILLKQVSDPTRLQVITLLSEGERHVGGLCDQFNLSQPAVSHHLALLRLGGIVDRRRQGKNNFYSLTDTGYRLSNISKAWSADQSPRPSTEPLVESEGRRRVVPCSVGNPLEEAHLPSEQESQEKHTLFRSGREVFQNSDFFLHEVLLYFNRLV